MAYMPLKSLDLTDNQESLSASVGARITRTIVCSVVLQCDGGTTTFYLCQPERPFYVRKLRWIFGGDMNCSGSVLKTLFA